MRCIHFRGVHNKIMGIRKMEDVICSYCFEPTETVEIEDGIGDYEFWGAKGFHSCIIEGSRCCGEDVVEGKVFLNKKSRHTARKDLFPLSNGSFRVLKGQRYESHIVKGYYIDGSGQHLAINEYWGYILPDPVPAQPPILSED